MLVDGVVGMSLVMPGPHNERRTSAGSFPRFAIISHSFTGSARGGAGVPRWRPTLTVI